MIHTQYLIDQIDKQFKPVRKAKKEQSEIDAVKFIKYFSDQRILAGVGEKQLRPTVQRKEMVERLVRAGARGEDLLHAVKYCFNKWTGTKMQDNLTLETILRPSNFWKYAEGYQKESKQGTWTE